MTKCDTCGHQIHEGCDFNQGRCPHRRPLVELQPKDTSPGHFYVSLVKSIIRIGAGACLIQGDLFFAGVLLIFAEGLGIVEELV